MFGSFENRRQAGRMLAEQLSDFADRTDTIVLGLPRGGVPIAFEVARKLRAPLDVYVVRKLGVPGQEELAFGAIATGGGRVLNVSLARALHLTDAMIERVTEREGLELKRREKLYRGSRPPPDLRDKTIIVVDDGLATGATMRAAVEGLKQLQPKEIVVAVPVGSREVCVEFENKADVLCVCAMSPEPFYGVGMWYQDFSQTSDEEVIELLVRAENMRQVRKTA